MTLENWVFVTKQDFYLSFSVLVFSSSFSQDDNRTEDSGREDKKGEGGRKRWMRKEG